MQNNAEGRGCTHGMGDLDERAEEPLCEFVEFGIADNEEK